MGEKPLKCSVCRRLSDEKKNQQIADERRPLRFQLHKEERRKMGELAESEGCVGEMTRPLGEP